MFASMHKISGGYASVEKLAQPDGVANLFADEDCQFAEQVARNFRELPAAAADRADRPPDHRLFEADEHQIVVFAGLRGSQRGRDCDPVAGTHHRPQWRIARYFEARRGQNRLGS